MPYMLEIRRIETNTAIQNIGPFAEFNTADSFRCDNPLDLEFEYHFVVMYEPGSKGLPIGTPATWQIRVDDVPLPGQPHFPNQFDAANYVDRHRVTGNISYQRVAA